MSLAAVSCSTNFTNQLALSLTVIEEKVAFREKINSSYFILFSTQLALSLQKKHKKLYCDEGT